MKSNIYALLAGINEYSPEVGRLQGCVNDVDGYHNFLLSHFDRDRLHIEVLKDSDATRANIIQQFRTHLGKAKKGDIVLFQYAGHGARWAAAPEFKPFYPDGKDEGLVCYDSRIHGQFDLADKELAALLAGVAQNEPHVVVILDCCHSGSGTRETNDFNGLKPRQTHEVFEARPLDSYLDGYYRQLQKAGKALSIPVSRHILLAACERVQKAWETPDHSGVFSATMQEVLGKVGAQITYADLFMRCRAAVRKRADNQDPQFETYQHFNAYAGFLGADVESAARRFQIFCENGDWKVNCGAIHGLDNDPAKKIELELFREDQPGKRVGTAVTTQIGLQNSEVTLNFEGDPQQRYQTELTTLPAAPFPVYLAGDPNGTEILQKEANPALNIAFCDTPDGTEYSLTAEDGQYLIRQHRTGKLLQGVKGYSEKSARQVLAFLTHIIQWERSLALQNRHPKLDPGKVDFTFSEVAPDGGEHLFSEPEMTLDYVKSGNDWQDIRCRVRGRNQTGQQLHFLLLYFSKEYGIHVLRNDPVISGPDEISLWGDDESHYLFLDDAENESVEIFKLIVSTEKIDDFLLTQEDLELGQIHSDTRGASVVRNRKKLTQENDWFTKTIRVHIVRQQNQVKDRDTALANGKIVVKGHPAVRANLSVSAAQKGSRGAGSGGDVYRFLEQHGLEMVNFAAGQRGENENILEITDIQNEAALAENPLQIEINLSLQKEEHLLPIAFDGEHFILVGDTFKDDRGHTHLSIDHLPEIPDQRRSLGKALKLYFFKTYLGHESVNQLRWVEYKADGTLERRSEGVAEKVAAAQKILLLIHGIIGDTEVIASGVGNTLLQDGKSIAAHFDVVLTFDYENLSTPISETAADLKKQLAAAGLGAEDGKQVTILAHSMGGLVSRWFIEQEGGREMVDHLVMAGTPNNGSPFGKVDSARKLFNMMTMVAINGLTAFAPFGAVVLSLLNRSKKITPTLEQMNPGSDFIQKLNQTANGEIPYTILAGSIEQYQEASDQFFAKLLDKVGKSSLFEALFGTDSHDIAVRVDSIFGVPAARQPQPVKRPVACHHLNYFVSEAGMQALAGVDW